MPKLNLKVWGGAWGLPSIEPSCLATIAYAQLSKAPIVLHEDTTANTVTGYLPELELDTLIYSDFFAIVGIFRREGYNADYGLCAEQQADTLAFLAYIERKIKPAVLYALWMDPNNYNRVTRPAYGKLFGFPRNLWAPGQMQQQVEEFIWHCGSFEGKTVLDIERFLYREARECFEVIEKMLANSTFFFGDRPTQIDAAIYGYLAILLKAPLVSTEIKNHLLSRDKMTSYCYKIERCFDDDVMPAPVSSEESVPGLISRPLRDTLLTLGIGTAAMCVYAVVSGIFTSRRSLLARQLGTAVSMKH